MQNKRSKYTQVLPPDPVDEERSMLRSEQAPTMEGVDILSTGEIGSSGMSMETWEFFIKKTHKQMYVY